MPEDLLAKWLNPQYLRTLLLDPEKYKATCIQIARFVAAYYLDYLLFLPADECSLPSLYLWGNFKKKDVKPTDTILDRVKVSSMLPVEYSPALPALLMVKCDSLIEAISYVDHFDDRRTSLIVRLLADSLHEKDLTIEFIKTMIVENLPLQMTECSKSPQNIPKFAQNFTESILQLDVAMQNDLVIFLEQHLISSAEFVYSELPLESDEVLPNPIYERPGEEADSEEAKAFMEVFTYIQILLESFSRSNRIIDQLNFTVKLMAKEGNIPSRISSNYSLHRVLLLMLRLTYRHLFSVALRENHPNLGKIAERYKQLLREDEDEHVLLQNWFDSAEEEEAERAQNFIDWIQNNYQQNSSLPPLTSNSRELWLRRIVLNSTTNHRDIRQERTMDWFRSVCHPKHRVCDIAMSQMLFINSQWTSPGFTFIQPGCLALRLSIHPHDLCLGTSTATVNFSASARDILYSPNEELSKFVEDDQGRLFTPRNPPNPDSPDLISKYAKKHQEMTSKIAQTARNFSPFEEQIRVFSRQQDELQKELSREKEFLKRAGHYHYPDPLEDFGIIGAGKYTDKDSPPKHVMDEALARQLTLLNEKIDLVVKGLADRDREKSMYIREDDEESEMSEYHLKYDDAPVSGENPVIEKLDFDGLSMGTPTPTGDHNHMFSKNQSSEESSMKISNGMGISKQSSSNHFPIPKNSSFEKLSASTAKSFNNPLFPETNSKTPFEWMKLLPLEAGSSRFADNLLTYNKNGSKFHKSDLSEKLENQTPRQSDFYQFKEFYNFTPRKVVTERGIGTQTSNANSTRSGETQTIGNDDVAKKVVDLKSIRRMSQEDIQHVLDKVVKL